MTPTRRYVRISLLAGVAAAVLVCLGVGGRRVIVGSEAGGWAYPYLHPFAPAMLVAPALVCAAAAAAMAVPWRVVRRHEWATVFAWLLIGLAGQAAIRSLAPFDFAQVFGSDTANSFYTPTLRHGAGEILADFDRLRETFPLHAKSNMPGKLLFVAGLRHVSEDPSALAWLVVIFSNLGGALLYVFVRDLLRDRRAALFSLIFYLFVPGKMYFFPLLNAATPVFAIACACLLLRWLTTGRMAYAAALGVALYVLVLFEPLPLVLGLLFAGLIARSVWIGESRGQTLLVHAAASLAAFAAVHLVLLGVFGFDLFGTFRQAQQDAAAFNLEADRAYGVWGRQNLLDFFFGVGACQAVIFAAVLADGVRRGVSSARELARPVAALALGLAAVLLATDLLGFNRGEVTRLWIFLACLFQVPAADACARLNGRAAALLVLGVTLVQAALGTAMIGFVIP